MCKIFLKTLVNLQIYQLIMMQTSSSGSNLCNFPRLRFQTDSPEGGEGIYPSSSASSCLLKCLLLFHSFIFLACTHGVHCRTSSSSPFLHANVIRTQTHFVSKRFSRNQWLLFLKCQHRSGLSSSVLFCLLKKQLASS